MRNNTQQSKQLINDVSLLSLTMELTILLVLPIIGCMLGGYIIDQFTGGGFFFLIGGAFLGMLIATIFAVRKVSTVLRSADEKYKRLHTHSNDKHTL